MNAKRKEELTCQNIMEALMDQLAFTDYTNWLDRSIPQAVCDVLCQETVFVHSLSQINRIKNNLSKEIEKVIQEADIKKPFLWADTVHIYAQEQAQRFLKVWLSYLDLETDPEQGISNENEWIVITIGEGIPTGNYWWFAYFNLNWRIIIPRVIVPEWYVSFIKM